MIRPVLDAEDPANSSIDYAQLSASDARLLSGATILPRDLRLWVLEHHAAEHGHAATLALFADFMALANSVVANNREMVELELMISGDYTEQLAEKINLPTIWGALQGVVLSDGVSSDLTCAGCAFRLGTPANQSPSTTTDASYCSHPGEDTFWCHQDVDEHGQPTRGCAGFAQVRSRRAREATA